MLIQEGFLRLHTVRGQKNGNKNYSSTVCFNGSILQPLRLEINLDMGDDLGKYSQELLEWF